MQLMNLLLCSEVTSIQHRSRATFTGFFNRRKRAGVWNDFVENALFHTQALRRYTNSIPFKGLSSSGSRYYTIEIGLDQKAKSSHPCVTQNKLNLNLLVLLLHMILVLKLQVHLKAHHFLLQNQYMHRFITNPRKQDPDNDFDSMCNSTGGEMVLKRVQSPS